MGEYFPWLAGLMAALVPVLLAWGVMIYAAERPGAEFGRSAKKKQEDETFILTRIAEMLGRPFQETVIRLLSDRATANVRRRLSAAGRPGRPAFEEYARRRAGEIVLYGVIGLFAVTSVNTMLGIILILLGLVLTDAQLLFDSRARQEKLATQLPDFLDVLAVTVTAGLGFRAALQRVSESMPGPLADEFFITLRQMELGTPRRDAFNELRDRNNSKAIAQFVTALLQAEELGAPLTQALIEISTDMRRESAQWARRKAQKVIPKITGVTAATILPGLMIVILGAMFFGIGGNGLGNILGG